MKTPHRLLAVAVALLFAPLFPLASETSQDAVVEELMMGNARFVEGNMGLLPRIGTERRQELVSAQHPKAIVLSCSDSRVPPEHVFRQGLGDVFVARIAGNVPMSGMIASIEYAVEHLHVPVLFVLGHGSCGAVKATIGVAETHEHLTPDLDALVAEIMPAVMIAQARSGDLLANAIEENAILAAENLLVRSAVVREAVRAKELKIVVGLYDLATGKVSIVANGVEPVAE